MMPRVDIDEETFALVHCGSGSLLKGVGKKEWLQCGRGFLWALTGVVWADLEAARHGA